MPKEQLDAFLNQQVLLEPAASGASELRTDTRRPLTILSVLVVLVLLIACANVANLMTAQASARARELALRVSIGGGRWRLVQLVLAQSVSCAAGGWARRFVCVVGRSVCRRDDQSAGQSRALVLAGRLACPRFRSGHSARGDTLVRTSAGVARPPSILSLPSKEEKILTHAED
jgi:hypothetical protein